MKQQLKQLMLTVLVALCSITASAHDFEVKGIYYKYNEDGTSVAVTYRGTGTDYMSNTDRYTGAVTIPSSVTYGGQTYRVTSIGHDAFYGCRGLTSVIIPNSVTGIGSWAFRDCSGLTEITIPNSVTSIGGYAFSGTAHYKNVRNWNNDVLYIDGCLIEVKNSISGSFIVKDGTRLIAGSAFSGCNSLTSVTIPSSVTNIGSFAFSGCSGLTTATIPESVTSIESSLFSGCSSLTSITIPNNMISIGESAFSGCSSLTTVTIPESVKSIGSGAFSGCNSLTGIAIPESVTSIERLAFSNCSSLTAIIIPNNVTSIGESAFKGCGGLTEVTIPKSVTNIESYAFENCSSLTTVSIPNSVTNIRMSVFFGCSSMKSITIPNSVTSIGEEAFCGCSSLTEITIPNSVTSISSYAFSSCSSLKSVTIGNNVTYIGNKAFRKCPRLTDVKVSWNNLEELYIGLEVFTDVVNITLWVPTGTTATYESQSPWNNFKEIREYVPGGNEGEEKCEAPMIAYQNGELVFSSATAGAKYYYSVACDDVTQLAESEDGHVKLAACYTITAYAYADGYDNSETVTATLFFTSATIDAVETAMAESAHGIVVMQQGSNIVLSGTEEGKTVNIYATDGKLIGSTVSLDGMTTIPCTPNSGAMYLVRYGETVVKCKGTR